MKKIKILIVDDSPLIRKVLYEILSSDSEIEVVGTASDPFIARDKILRLKPDVITLDVEMPLMNGITFLKRIMHYKPLPVVMISSYTRRNCELTVEALASGAVDFVSKPFDNFTEGMAVLKDEIIAKIKAAAHCRVKRPSTASLVPIYPSISSQDFPEDRIIVIGASTGGTQAIREILHRMPKGISGIAIVQHIPPEYTKVLAKRMDELSQVQVKEAENNQRLRKGWALIAPGGKHMRLRKDPEGYYVTVEDGSLTDLHRPSIDTLFYSAAECAKNKAIGVILTGMGRDGAKGMLALKKEGAFTIAQDENSSVVFGMPKAAIELGAADEIVPLEQIPEVIISKLISREKTISGKDFNH